MNNYLILNNFKTNKKLVYYPVPKNANTSIKMFLAMHLKIDNKFEYRDDIPRFKRKLDKYYKKPSISALLPSYTKFQKVIADYKICIIRNPIERFISAFEN